MKQFEVPKDSKFKTWDQDPVKDLSPKEVEQMYENGFAGALCSEEASEELESYLSIPNADDVCRVYGFEETAKGKLVIPYQHIEKYYGDDSMWQGLAQKSGNCFVPGTEVTMSDGSKKPIEQVSVGESVITHNGINQVYELVENHYSDDTFEFFSPSYNKTVKSTNNHIFPVLSNKDSKNLEWKKAKDIKIGDHLILGKPRVEESDVSFDLKDYGGEITEDLDFKTLRLAPVDINKCRGKNGFHQCNRYIKFDEKLAYIIGAFLAEGSCEKNDNKEPVRLTFSLSSKEILFRERIISYIKDIFDIDCSYHRTGESVTQIRLSSKPISTLIYTLCGSGNVYSKSAPWQALSLNKSIKLSLLQGWIDGDGYYSDKSTKNGKTYQNQHRVIAVSVCKKLINSMQEIANSCDLKCSILTRKAYKQSKKSYSLNFYGDNALAVKKQTFTKNIIVENLCKYGIPIKISNIKREKYEGHVYCINVKDDHTFIANGILTHNCVSEAQELANLLSMCCEVSSEKPDEVTGYLEEIPKSDPVSKSHGPIAWEPIYWWRGYDGDGWYCSAAVQVSLTKCGIVPRIKISDDLDFRTDDDRHGHRYGKKAPPAEIAELIGQNLFRDATRIDSFESLRDLLNRGFGVTSCGSEGFSKKRDANGFSPRSGSWAHAMAMIGVDDRPETIAKYREPLVLIINSWGLKWNSGPRTIFNSKTLIPEGAFWTRWSDVKRRDMYAMAGLNGWARKELPDLSPHFV